KYSTFLFRLGGSLIFAGSITSTLADMPCLQQSPSRPCQPFSINQIVGPAKSHNYKPTTDLIPYPIPFPWNPTPKLLLITFLTSSFSLGEGLVFLTTYARRQSRRG